MEMGERKEMEAHCSMLWSVSSPQLSFYSYLPDQILKDAILDTNKSICKSNLLHSESWMPLTVLKWTPVSFPCCHLRDLGFTSQSVKQLGVGSADLEVMNRGTEAAEIWPKAPRKSVVVVVKKTA